MKILGALVLVAGLMVQLVPSAFAQTQQGSKFTPVPDVTVGAQLTVIRPANSARVVLTCTNNDTSNSIRIGGDSTVGPSAGQRVPPGGSFAVTALSAVNGFSEGGSVVVSCSEEIR